MAPDLQQALEQAVQEKMEKQRKAKTASPARRAGQTTAEEEAVLAQELGNLDALAAPPDDYRKLATMLGKTPRWLVANGINPFQCSLIVERRAPTEYEGEKVKTGVLRQYSMNYPFDLDKLAERLEEEQGGEDYVIIVRHAGKPLASQELTIDAPPVVRRRPATAPAAPPPPVDEAAAELERERLREERRAQMLRARHARMGVEREVEREAAPPAPPFDPEMLARMREPEDDADTMTRAEAERLWREREERMNQRMEMDRLRQETERRMDALLSEIRELRSAPQDGGNAALVSAINQSTSSQVEGLKMVMQMVTTQLSNVVQSQQTQFQNTVEMMKLGQDSKGKEMELLLNAAGARQEMSALTADKQMELMRAGIEMAQRMANPAAGGDEDVGWANKAGNMLIGLISQNLSGAGGNNQANGAPELSEEQINAAAQKIAQRAVAQMRQRQRPALPQQAAAPRPRPAPQPAPPEPEPLAAELPPEKPGEREAFIRGVWPVLLTEIESMPTHSKTFDMLLGGPPRVLADLRGAQRVGDVVSLVSSAISAEELGAVADKFMDEEVQRWLYTQIQNLKGRE